MGTSLREGKDTLLLRQELDRSQRRTARGHAEAVRIHRKGRPKPSHIWRQQTVQRLLLPRLRPQVAQETQQGEICRLRGKSYAYISDFE